MSDAERFVARRGPNLWLVAMGVLAAFGCMAAAIIMPILASKNESSSATHCASNLRYLARATSIYLTEFDERLPAKDWNLALAKYEPDDVKFACPTQRRIDPKSSGYALSNAVAGKQATKIESPEEVVMFFDSRATVPGIVDDPSNEAEPKRHRNGRVNNVVYLDGHTKEISNSR